MGFITRNRFRAHIDGVLDLFPLIVIGFNVTNLSYLLGDKGDDSISFF